MSAVKELIELARSNGGVFTTHEALALGVTKSRLRRRVEEGVFVRIERGVFVLPGTATRADVMLRAACRSLGAVVSHESAAKLHRLEPIKVESPTVTVSHRGTHRFEGIRVHQSTDLLEAHLEMVNGLRTTNPYRTIIDLAQTTGVGRLERVVDNALATRTIDLGELINLHMALSRKGKPGVRTLRGILERRAGEPAIKISELEARFRALIRAGGLPEPTREFHAPWLKPIDGRVDFAYVPEQLLVEADSRRWHVLFDAFETDRRRDNAAQLAGWRVLRFTWRMIEEEPIEVVAAIRTALQRSKPDKGHS